MKEKLKAPMASFLQIFSTCWIMPTAQKMRAVRNKQSLNRPCSEMEKWDGEPRKVILSSIEINCHKTGNAASIYVISTCCLSDDHPSYFSSWPSLFKHISVVVNFFLRSTCSFLPILFSQGWLQKWMLICFRN